MLSFDREGRLVTYFEEGTLYKRSLSSEVHQRVRREGRRVRRRLETTEALRVFTEAYALAERSWSGAEQKLRERLQGEVLAWSPERLLAEEKRFKAAYRPIAILPPDQYAAVVVQATEGCTWNRCTFCNFYTDRPFRVQLPEAFTGHLNAVQDLLGRGLLLRKNLFIADGNALALSRRRLLPLLALAGKAFPGRPLASFLDVYSGEQHDSTDWPELRELGLKRIYLGMETGHDPLLAFVNKPGSSRELASLVGVLKRARFSLGLIVMVGLGGTEYRERHAVDTLRLLATLPLSQGDLVYLSPFVEHQDGRYATARQAAGLTPMREEEVELELSWMALKIRGLGLRAARYDIREFLY